jgi:pilus assembly protein CpaE
MHRKVLIVEGAAPLDDSTTAVLQRFDFSSPVTEPTVAAAAARMREEHFDLVLIPLDGTDAVDLATLERETRASGTTSVIGTAANADANLILRALRSGVHEFLVYPPEPREFTSAVDRLIRRTAADRKQTGAVFAVYSGKGGMGTSTVAVNVAAAIARIKPDSRIALADFVVAGGDLGVLLDLKPAYTIGDLVGKVDNVDAELLYSLMTFVADGVFVLPSSERPEVAEDIDTSVATSILGHLRSHFAYTVVDLEHHMSERTLATMDLADRILLVTQLNVPALRNMQRTVELCRRLGYADEKLCVIINRDQGGDVVSANDAAKVLGLKLFHRLPNDYQTVAAALTRGLPVSEQAPSSALARSFDALAGKLVGSGDLANTNGHLGGRLGRLFSIGRK